MEVEVDNEQEKMVMTYDKKPTDVTCDSGRVLNYYYGILGILGALPSSPTLPSTAAMLLCSQKESPSPKLVFSYLTNMVTICGAKGLPG
jgi:hypothetical protein